MTLKNVGSNCDSIRAANLGVLSAGSGGGSLKRPASATRGQAEWHFISSQIGNYFAATQCAHELKAGAGGWRIAFGRLPPLDKSSTTKGGKGGRAWLTDIPADATATLVPDLRHLAPRRCLRLF